ncbi:MAG TPA: hypothetical protein VF027_02870 [Sphingomicrobium sp.]
MILRLLNIQGIAGLAASACLGLLLILQKGETRQWRKQSSQFEQLYRDEHAARAATVANYRAAADAARAADRAAGERARAQQQAISERTSHDYETRLADARARALRLRSEARAAAANPGGSGTAAMPALSAAAGQPPEAAREDRLPAADALLATEQAIQLDALIRWIRRQHAVDPNAATSKNR